MNAPRPMLRLVRDLPDPPPAPIDPELPRSAGDRALDAMNEVSRRMKDLARTLHCLGYFDDDDRPRAA